MERCISFTNSQAPHRCFLGLQYATCAFDHASPYDACFHVEGLLIFSSCVRFANGLEKWWSRVEKHRTRRVRKRDCASPGQGALSEPCAKRIGARYGKWWCVQSRSNPALQAISLFTGNLQGNFAKFRLHRAEWKKFPQ